MPGSNSFRIARRRGSLLILGVLAAIPHAGCAAVDASAAVRVDELLTAMREGHWSNEGDPMLFPSLGWEHVEYLLSKASSTVPLKRYPINRESSEAVQSCPEGMLALWIVESIRRNRPSQFPSLTPCVLHVDDSEGGALDPTLHHAAVAQAYRRWWASQASLNHDELSAADPLQGTGLAWF